MKERYGMRLLGLLVVIQAVLFSSETRGQPLAPMSFELERAAWERAFWAVSRRGVLQGSEKLEELVRDFFDSTRILRFPEPEWGPFSGRNNNSYFGRKTDYRFTIDGLQARVPGERFEPGWLWVWPLDHEERLERVRKLREQQSRYD